MRRGRTSLVRRVALLLVTTTLACGALGACASTRPYSDPPGVPEPTEVIENPSGYESAPTAPGAFVVRYDATELRLEPFTYCYANGCVDGMDPDPPSVGSPDELLVFVPVAGFTTLHAGQRSSDDYCTARSLEAVVTDLGEGWWSVAPSGPAHEYIVDLFASGDGVGDMAATLRWTTPTDRPLPDPIASLALIADHDGVPDSYGLEFSVSNLSESPGEYSSTITVTAANGRSLTLDATTSNDCAGEGALFFDGPDAAALAAAALGDFPFTYDVELVLDGETYSATAVYPDDVIEEHGVAVALEFSPRLP